MPDIKINISGLSDKKKDSKDSKDSFDKKITSLGTSLEKVIKNNNSDDLVDEIQRLIKIISNDKSIKYLGDKLENRLSKIESKLNYIPDNIRDIFRVSNRSLKDYLGTVTMKTATSGELEFGLNKLLKEMRGISNKQHRPMIEKIIEKPKMTTIIIEKPERDRIIPYVT